MSPFKKATRPSSYCREYMCLVLTSALLLWLRVLPIAAVGVCWVLLVHLLNQFVFVAKSVLHLYLRAV